jgi:membrane-associated phospholipid phosphatase
MQFHKVISTILHPIVIPTLGVLLYFIYVSQSLAQKQKFLLLGLVFGITYVIPVLTLVLLKALGLIKSFQVETIRERRMSVLLMMVLFYFLGKTLADVPSIRDLGFLFYGTSISLFCTYILFAVRIKSSLHLLSMGAAVSFFLILSNVYALSLLPIVMVLILLSGLLASSRLYLKAHNSKELLIGFSLGFVFQLLVFWVL